MISFIYFDVGGVVIKDFSATDKWEQFKKDFNLTDEYWDKYEHEINCGRHYIDPTLILNFVNRFEKNETIWPVLKFAENKFKLGLLTNMYPGMLQAIKNKKLLPPIDWEVVVDSSLEGFAKPDKKFYEIAQERAEVFRDQILFVENTFKNVQAANNLGWQTFWYDSNDYEKSSHSLQKFLRTVH